MKVVVHVGLPKAATTSLQTAYFPAIAAENPGTVYAGPIRPGCRRQPPLYEAFTNALRDGIERPFLDALERVSAGTVIFSLALGAGNDAAHGAAWKATLVRLARILAPTDYAIVVTLRDPLDAAYSHFAANCHRLPRRKRQLLLQAGTAPFEIFRYGHVFGTLFQLVDPDRVTAVGFGDIVFGRMADLDAALGVVPRTRLLPHLARSCRIAEGIRCERLSLEESVARYLPPHIVRHYVGELPLQMRRSKFGQRLVVPYLTAVDAGRLREFYAPHLDFVRRRFGLDAGENAVGCASRYPVVAPDRVVSAARTVRLSTRAVDSPA